MPHSKPKGHSPTNGVPTPHEYLRGMRLDDLPELLTVNQVMERLGVSRQLVHRLIERGELAAVNVGPHTLRVFRASLVDYLERKLMG